MKGPKPKLDLLRIVVLTIQPLRCSYTISNLRIILYTNNRKNKKQISIQKQWQAERNNLITNPVRHCR